MNKILTIIVPTYNGGDKLKWSLGTLMPLVKEVEDRVQVLVNDNCSTDNTEEIVRTLMAQYPGLIDYHRQSKNLGSDPNFFDAAERARTKYICLMGDDDKVTPMYFNVIFSVLEKYPNLAYINYNMLVTTYEGMYLGIREKQTVSHYYERGVDFVLDHMDPPSLMTSNVFLREPFVEAYHSATELDYPGYNWYYCMLKSIMHAQCYYIGYPIAMCGEPTGGKEWKKDEAYYAIYGLGHIFKDLSADSPSIYEAWKKRMFVENNAKWYISCVMENKDYYSGEIFQKMLPFIDSDHYKRLFSLALKNSSRMYLWKTDPAEFLNICFNKLFSLLRKLNK